MRPKILIGISSSYCASFLKGQVAFLVQHGYEVVIISGPGEEISMLSKEEGARLISIPFSTEISPLRDLKQLFQIISFLKKERPGIVNAGNPKSGFLITLAGWLIGQGNRIFTMHGLVSDTRSGFKKWIIGITEKLSCRLAHKVIVVSPSLREHAEKRGILKKGKGIVIENGSCNGVDTEIYARTPAVLIKADEMRRKLKIEPGQQVVGFVGRLSKDKGIDLLINSFNRITNKHANARLLVVGPLITNNQLSQSVLDQLYNDNKIIYVGKLQDVIAAYALMNMLVLPSLREGFGNVLTEASAMEVPVVAADIPGCRDAVQHLHTGELFEKGSIDALTKALEKLITQPELAQQYGRRGREYVSHKFSNQKIWQGYLQLYNQAINK